MSTILSNILNIKKMFELFNNDRSQQFPAINALLTRRPLF